MDDLDSDNPDITSVNFRSIQPTGNDHIPSPPSLDSSLTTNTSTTVTVTSEEAQIVDPIKVIYHPHSERQEEVASFKDYRHRGLEEKSTPKDSDKEPWSPFRTRGDFDYAEIALAAGLNMTQSNALIALITRVAKGESELTLTSHADLQKCWKTASLKLTEVCYHFIANRTYFTSNVFSV